MDKLNKLAWVLINSLNDEQRKQLHVLTNQLEGVTALEDEVPSALHDQSHNGDKEAWKLLEWDKDAVGDVVDRGVYEYDVVEDIS